MNRPAIVPHVFRVAFVGAATLKGRELKEVLDEMNFPVADVKLLDDDESLGQLAGIGRAHFRQAPRFLISRMLSTGNATSQLVHRGSKRNWNVNRVENRDMRI